MTKNNTESKLELFNQLVTAYWNGRTPGPSAYLSAMFEEGTEEEITIEIARWNKANEQRNQDDHYMPANAGKGRKIPSPTSPSETFTTINRWQNETFPNATPDGIWNHIAEEWIEFQTTNTTKAQITEAVDLIILLTGWIHKVSGGRPAQEFVDAKMRVNRNRDWTIQPDGTGRHK